MTVMINYVGSLLKNRICDEIELSAREDKGLEIHLRWHRGVLIPSLFLMNEKIGISELKDFSLVMAALSSELSDIVQEKTLPILCKKCEKENNSDLA